MKLKKFKDFINESNISYDDLSTYLEQYAQDNIGNDPGGEPAYYLNVNHDSISIGTFLNPKYSKTAMDISDPKFKKELEDEWKEFAEHLKIELKNEFGLNYYTEFITINKTKQGVILKKSNDFVTEDVFYEKEKEDKLNSDNIEKLVKSIIDEETEWVYIRRNGKDIEVGTMPYKNKENKNITPKFDKDEAQELMDKILNKLSKEGYGEYEVDYIGDTAFRISKYE